MIPDRVQKWIQLASEDVVGPFEQWGGGERAKEEYSDALNVLYFLDSQPTMPEPDWSMVRGWGNAADGLNCFIMTPHGDQVVYFRAADVAWYNDGLPSISQALETGWEFPLTASTKGIDWRQTLRRRAGAE